MPLITTDLAAKKLNHNDVVALPTETVYGLGASIKSDVALKKIFKIKSRPLFDPLIVHVKNIKQAESFGHWDSISLKLANNFWPGPLTIVVPKKENVSELITSGGATVAFRQPDHPLFLEVLNQLDIPIAAPSANLFGHTSPTTALHVLSEFNDTVDVVDGGPCIKGIESTVVEFDTNKNLLKILRLGLIGQLDLSDFLKLEKPDINVEIVKQENTPGFLKNHYQPKAPFFLVFESCTTQTFDHNNFKNMNQILLTDSLLPKEWTLPDDPILAARELYNQLRLFSDKKQASFIIIKKKWQSHDTWQSLLDRLQKACHGSFNFKNDQWLFQSK